ncbi:Lrp/AsnC family transcriptional regulator [Methanocella sp. CWC-04]|uniref:Lrp/AsnC family transcriptional regulator n=1 Tax=Methanooceanicella nereidis TaxID=2052831 RepID=A0AAP2RBH6_9EURY|nr:Lrp/AsnC family transcriptional regulator [Methanocella sp. CWC-04]MCD1294393.1 Lrp/AsnC family transcriptional regulator [Methanocella sp. CWC-04]
MDLTDRTIIEKLTRDSRIHCTEIASELGVATSTVHKRVNQLYNDGVIEQFTIILNPEKSGTALTTFIGINVDSGRKDEVINTLKSLNNVLEVYELLEPYDIFVKVRTRDISELKENVLRVIANTKGVLNTSSILTTRRHKENACITKNGD